MGEQPQEDPKALGIGAERLGEFARGQLEQARSDPRAERTRRAMVADYWNALEEAERARELGVSGLFELQGSLEREEAKRGVRRGDAGLSGGDRAALQAAWERGEMASAEIANEHPFLHAAALIAMLSALDAMVEELVPKAQEIIGAVLAERAMATGLETLGADEQAAWKALGDEQQHAITEALRAVIAERMPKPGRPVGAGTDRYETLLEKVGLDAPANRPIPGDLNDALTEIVALRHVLVHRGGRVDAKALSQAPTLPYADGDFVRLSRADYRRYSAAVRAYGAEIIRRLLGGLGPDIDLTKWHGWYRINA